MIKKPDNIIYNYNSQEYDAFKKEYPTSFNSKTFRPENIKIFKSSTRHYFESRLCEIKEKYEVLLEEIECAKLIHNAQCNFTPIVGKTYHLYKGEGSNFLSIICPNEWHFEYLGSYKLTTNDTWSKIK